MSSSLKLCGDLTTVPEAEWDACAGPENPFVSHAFLTALEEAGCASAEEGWMPQHLLLENPDGHLIGCAPMYLKSHSQGEYVFDHGWANALERAGGGIIQSFRCLCPSHQLLGRDCWCAGVKMSS